MTTEKTVEYSTTKRVAGDYKVFFYDEASLQNFFSTSASIELGGVALNYQDLRQGSGTTHRATLYEDHTVGAGFLSWENTSGFDRPNTEDRTNQSSASTGGAAQVYFDLNGHSVTNTSTKVMEMKGITLYLYSSQLGAHWLHTTAGTALYVSDDCTLALGNNSTDGEYARNINFHVNQLFAGHYGGGVHVWGGNYYQAEGTGAYLANVARRVNTVKHANFYVKDGVAVFGEASAYNGNTPLSNVVIEDCNFYSNGSSPVFLSAGQGTASLKFKDCTFNGVTVGTVTDVSGNTFDGAAVTYNTVTWADGTSSFYYATSEAEAKAFVENHPKAAQPAPYGKYVDGEYFAAFNPSFTYAYDDAFNAEQTLVDGELTKVYFEVQAASGETVFYTNEKTAGTDLRAYLQGMSFAGSTTVLHSDITCEGIMVNGVATYAQRLDLNGHTLTLTTMAAGWGALDIRHNEFYLYSSREGGILDAGTLGCAFHTNDGTYGSTKNYGDAYIGEYDRTRTDYGKNLTVYCKAVVSYAMHGTNIEFNGGTYVQTGSTYDWFLQMGRTGENSSHIQNVKNCTFVLTNPATVPLHLRSSASRTFTNCTFIAANTEGGVALNAYADIEAGATSFTFKDCHFVNVKPYLGSAKVIYDGSAFGGTAAYTTEDLDITDAAQYLAHGKDVKTVEAYGKTYTLDGTIITDPTAALKITHPSFGTDYWVVDATVSVPLDEVAKIEDGKHYSGAYYDYSGIAEIVDRVVKAAGEATAVISFTKSEDLAFTYTEKASGVLYGVRYETDCGGTAAGVGDKFHELFAAATAGYDIVMYKDMLLTKAVPFGPLVKTADAYNRDYYNSFAYGSIDWDLNGTTVTVSKDVTGLVNLAAANYDLNTPTIMNAYNPAVFGFENTGTSNGLTLHSSKAGAQFVNESSAAIFGVGEGKKSMLTINGENITFISEGLINASNESGGSHLTINGGTYIGNSIDGVLRLSYNSSLSNATFISTNAKAARVIYLDGYRAATDTFTNCTFVAANVGAPIVGITHGSNNFTLNFDGCTFAGATLVVTGGRYNAVNYTNGGFASTVEDLAKIYASAPAGTVLAAKSVAYNGVSYKLCGYYAETESFVTVKIPLADITETWVVGGEYIYSTSIENVNVVYQDGKYYYRANPVWTAKLGDEVITDILSAKNAGKIVVLDVGGELETVYAIRDIAGVKTYFYGDVEKVNAELCAMFTAMQTSSTVTFYEDFTLSITVGTQTVNAGGGTQNIDLNGHTLKVVSSHEEKAYAFKFQKGKIYVYSSAPNGVIDASEMPSLVMTDGSGNAYFGESSTSGTAYGENLTVYCRWFSGGRLWSDNAHIYGGTYVQTAAADYFFTHDDGPVPTVKNATFILDGTAVAAIRRVVGTYENCVFISKSPVNLFAAHTSNNTGATFNGCYFYNIIPNVIEGATVTYTDCHFDKASDIAQAGGYIAYTGETVTLTVKDETYAFAAKLYAAGEVALIDWGFDMKEYWAIGAEASHADVLLDQFFTYSYAPFAVEGDCKAEKTLALAAGTVQMSLTLQSQIGVNLYFSEALSGATIKYAGAEIPLATLVAADGFYKLSAAVAPNVADQVATVTIVIGENEHVLTVGIGAYARAVLASEDYADVHKLTYAMVEYVRSMVASDFLVGVGAPAGYDEAPDVDTEKLYNKGENVLLNAISFNLSGTIEIAIEAGDAEDGAVVTLTLASGRTVTATIEGGVASFEGLYINEFYGDLTISVGNETYSYCIENYHNAMDEAHKPAIKALYTYAYYAVEYVATLQ